VCWWGNVATNRIYRLIHKFLVPPLDIVRTVLQKYQSTGADTGSLGMHLSVFHTDWLFRILRTLLCEIAGGIDSRMHQYPAFRGRGERFALEQVRGWHSNLRFWDYAYLKVSKKWSHVYDNFTGHFRRKPVVLAIVLTRPT